MTRWTYQSLVIANDKRDLELEKMGTDGWELVNFHLQTYDSYLYVFKRQTCQL